PKTVATSEGMGRVRRSRRRGRGQSGGEDAGNADGNGDNNGNGNADAADAADDVESVGAEDALEEVPDRRPTRRKVYKIQEVIKRRQILLVQVVKEERGTKGAALTTYMSLAGRYCVLMPNTARGGGISRKITNHTDRKRLKTIATDLDVPQGMGVIVRTAGANRTKAEIRRDYDYLIRLWETIRELTLKSAAPSLIYEEGSLIKRSIRDLYNKDIAEVIVEGEQAYKEAKAFMKMLMPSHTKYVQQYKDPRPLFTRYRVEAQLDLMFTPEVTLPSGGYLVINQTEALVAIDVNSGKATREHNIENTATKTNLEAAAEVARQLRLRDLAGLIVIDFIDMEENRNNRAVERKMKDSLKTDRARIQVGRISHFGLLEMSRQRIRSSVIEGTMDLCGNCAGTGRVRAVGSTALQIIRAIEEQAQSGSGRNLNVRTSSQIALYMLNTKRANLHEIETRFGIEVTISVDPDQPGSNFVVDRGAVNDGAVAQTDTVVQIDSAFGAETTAASLDVTEPSEPEQSSEEEESEDGAPRRKRRRRRRGRRRQGEDSVEATDEDGAATGSESGEGDTGEADAEIRADAEDDAEATQKSPRRRGRRGGRRRSREDSAERAERASSPTEATGQADEADADSEAGAGAETSVAAQPSADAGEKTSSAEAKSELSETSENAGEEAAAPVKKPRVRRSRAKAPKTTESDASSEPTPKPKATRAKTTRSRAKAKTDPKPEPKLEPAMANGDGAPASESKTAAAVETVPPRKRGWWQRKLTGE
ncbi:Ribonuclease E, partial [hydrothermal vent metagenome]